jgi:MFS family permease
LDKLEETKRILQKVARMNKRSLPPGRLVPLQGQAMESRNPLSRFRELFSTRVLRGTTPRIWAMAFCAQFASAGSVFALPKLLEDYFLLGQKTVSLYLLLGLIGVIPGLALAWYVVEISRKKSLAAYYGVASLGAIGFAVATLSSIRNEVFALVMSLLLRGGMEGMFSILNTIRIEVYPTTNRVTAMGVSQVWYNIGGMVSPLLFGVMSQTTELTWICMALYSLAYLTAIIPTITLSQYSDFTNKPVLDRIGSQT